MATLKLVRKASRDGETRFYMTMNRAQAIRVCVLLCAVVQNDDHKSTYPLYRELYDVVGGETRDYLRQRAKRDKTISVIPL
jgi:hypothetical protein